MADDLEKKKKLITEINALYAKLGQQNPFGELKESVEDMRFLVDLHNELKEQIYDIDGGINEMIGSWKAIVDEAKTYSNSISSSKKSLSSLSSIASSLANHYKGINSLSEKQLESLKTKFKVEKESLSQLERSLSEQLNHGDLTNKQRQEAEVLLATITGLLIEQESVLNITENTLNEVLKRHQDISKQLGFYPKVLGGIDKMLHRLGLPEMGINKALEETYKLGQEAEISGGKFNALGTFMNQLKTNIAGAFTKANLLQFAITELALALKTSDEGAGDMAKKMNLTYTEALRVRGELGTMAALSGDVALTTKGLQESLLAINQSLGTNGKISEQDLITFTKLREQSGLTNEQLVSMQKYSMATGGTLKDNVEKFQATSKILSYQNKVALNTKQLMVDMGAVSNRVKLSIEGGAEGLAKAAVNAKLMGGDLEKVSAIADQLLNFESSIEAELSAELLTGKNITLEKARQAALNNDLATVASEITNQMGSAKDFANSNRIQQDAIAKAMGMSADQLGDMLFEQEALRKVGKKLSDDEQRAFETAKQKFGVEEASRMLREGQLDQMVEQQTIQDRFNQSVLKLQEIFVSLAEPILQIVSPIASMVGWLASIPGLLKTIAAGFMVIKGIQAATYAIQLATTHQKMVQGSLDAREIMMGKTKIAQLVAQATAWALMNPVGAAIGAAAAVGIGALIYSSMKDGIIDPKKGPILSGEFGSVQLNPRDKAMYGADGNIKVGTNLAGITASSPSQDNSTLIAEIRAMRNELNNRPVVVHSVVKTENNDVLARGVNSSDRKGFKIQ